MEQIFAASVIEFILPLRGIRAPVTFEVQFADLDRQLFHVGFQPRKKLFRRSLRDAREPVHIARPAELLDHFPGRPAAAIPVAKEEVTFVGALQVFVVADIEQQFSHATGAVVGVGRREMGEHPAAVDAFPPKGVRLRFVNLVPRKFLRQEPVNAGPAHDLR